MWVIAAWNCAPNGPIAPIPESTRRWEWSIGGMVSGSDIKKGSEKTIPLPLRPSKPHMVLWERTRPCTTKGPRLTTWTMAWKIHLWKWVIKFKHSKNIWRLRSSTYPSNNAKINVQFRVNSILALLLRYKEIIIWILRSCDSAS